MLYTHHCELTKSSDYALSELPKKCSITTFKKLLQPWIIINENHPKCGEYLISLAVINKERRRHKISKDWWIIHPFSKIRFFWETIMMIVYFLAYFITTFSVCFIILDYKMFTFPVTNTIIYAFFWIDIFSNCITGYYDKNKDEFIIDQVTILKHYSKTYLLIDIFTSLPYEYITLPWRRFPATGFDNEMIIVTTINLIPLLKLTRYLTFRMYVKQTFLYFDSENISCEMCSTLLFCIYVIHWFTCSVNVTHIIKIYSQKGSINPNQDTWLVAVGKKSIHERYRRAINIVLENFTGSGFGGIEPQSESDIAVCTLLMIFGVLVESYIIIMLLHIIEATKSSESKYEQIVDELCAYAMQKQLPVYMKRRLLAYYHYRFRNSYFREKKILSNLSDSLRKEVVLHSCRRLVETVEIFQNLPYSVLTQIVLNLKPELYLAKDTIIKAGIQGDCMFFLSSGTVAVITPTGQEVCYLKDGAYFGEVALLVQDQRRVANVVAVDVCEVYRLDRKDFRKCIAIHSDLYAKIERIATERIQYTGMIDEEYKNYVLHSSSATNLSRAKSVQKK